jgi:hypothetical protein
MRRIETYGVVNDEGVLKISYRSRFIDAVKVFRGKRIRLTVEPLYKQRSTKSYNEETEKEGRGQNGYYFGIVIHEFMEGYWETYGEQITAKNAHETLKRECNGIDRMNDRTGEIVTFAKSTADLNTVEFEEYLERCRNFILEWFGRTVLKPNEQAEIFT